MSEQNDQLRDLFRLKGRRLTPQRRLILEVVEESETHLDAEAIHARVKLQDPNISLATVYRTLPILKQMGLVEEHRLGEGHSHYEAARNRPHYHFVCLGCGKVIEFDAPLLAQVIGELSEQRGVSVTHAHLRLSGYCTQCQSRAEGEDPYGE